MHVRSKINSWKCGFFAVLKCHIFLFLLYSCYQSQVNVIPANVGYSLFTNHCFTKVCVVRLFNVLSAGGHLSLSKVTIAYVIHYAEKQEEEEFGTPFVRSVALELC